MTIANPLRPLGWKASLGTYAIFASVLYITHYILIPRYTESTGKPYLIGYLWGWTLTCQRWLATARNIISATG